MVTHNGFREMNMGKGSKMDHYMSRGKKKKQEKPEGEKPAQPAQHS
jgi:hypothetical protein